MAELTHDPCCSSHGASLDCATYRRTHFVEVGPCCSAWREEHGDEPRPRASKRKPMFGGNGKPQGDATTDPMGAVRRSPDGTMLAIQWPSPPVSWTWAVSDCYGAVGYEKPERVQHWPIIGAVPGSPAAGMELVKVELSERSTR